jgi:hypothetical protein
MTDDNIIAFNVTNWVTVLIMVSIGFAFWGFVAKTWQNRSGAAS